MSDTTTRRAELTAVELEVVWEHLQLGRTPLVLRLASPGRTERERKSVVSSAWAQLRRRGLADGDGLDQGLGHLLRILGDPDQQLEMRAGPGRSTRAVAAGRAGDHVLAVRQGDVVAVERCDSLPGAVLGVLPDAGPGSGYACTLPTTTLRAALAANGPGLRAALISRGVPAGDAGVLARMLDGGGQAQIVAGTPERPAATRRPDEILTVHDGGSGRYLISRLVGEDGTEWTTVGPTDHRRLRHRVAALLEPQPCDGGGSTA